jgi:hypothetical protein
MKKTYEAPDVVFTNLVPSEKITNDDWIDGEMGTESNTIFD